MFERGWSLDVHDCRRSCVTVRYGCNELGGMRCVRAQVIRVDCSCSNSADHTTTCTTVDVLVQRCVTVTTGTWYMSGMYQFTRHDCSCLSLTGPLDTCDRRRWCVTIYRACNGTCSVRYMYTGYKACCCRGSCSAGSVDPSTYATVDVCM